MRRKGESGQALVLAALGLTVFMLAAGLAIDMGFLRYQKRRMQTAADSAAIAGATQLGGDFTDAAIQDAGLNGFSTTNGATITPTPVACPDATMTCVQVVVSQQQPLFFMRVIPNITLPTVSAMAVAQQKQGLGCMYALSNASDALTVGFYVSPTFDGFHTIVAGSTCAIVDNGTLNVDFDVSHSIYASSVTAASYVGPQDAVTPTPVTIPVPAGDPFASLSAPSAPPACGGLPTTYVAGCFMYPNGLSITSGTITLDPGVYEVGGTGLTISGNGVNVTGTGVTLYVAGPNAAVNINNGVGDGSTGFGATVHLQAPTDGSYAGVVLFQDQSDSQTASVALAGFQWSGSPDDPSYPGSYLWGAMYVPSATVMLAGIGFDNPNPNLDKCSSVPRFTSVVALKLVLDENINFSANDCVDGPPIPVSTRVPSPNRNAVLVK